MGDGVLGQCLSILCQFFYIKVKWELQQNQANGQNQMNSNRELQNTLLNQQQQNQRTQENQKNNEFVPKPSVFLFAVEQLYEISLEKNKFPRELIPFIGAPQSQWELIDYYAKDNCKIEEELKKYLKGYQRVRMDGNSFYAAFMYQYLVFVLNQLTDSYFKGFIAYVRKMNFQMQYYQNYNIPNQTQNPLANCFADRLVVLRRYPLDLFKQFSDSSDLLFGLSILFIRNLVNEMYCRRKMVQKIDDSSSQEFLFWEQECTMNSTIMAFLAEELKLQQLDLNLQDQQKEHFKHDVYYQKGVYSIHLIQHSGHFQIGIGTPIGQNQ